MKILVALLSLFCLAQSAHAVTPRINQGDWILGGSLSLTAASHSSTYFVGNAEAEYFVADRLATGLQYTYYATSGYSAYLAAPMATFHFRAGDIAVPYLSVMPFEFGRYTGSSAYYASAGRLGVKFFLTDSVAFGPAVDYQHIWARGVRSASDTFIFLAVFSIHL